jgi:N-acyl-D-aspartate/D-glutamate deacylase
MRTRFSVSLATVAIAAALVVRVGAAERAASDATYDLWIRNGTVIDGTGRDRVQADVLVSGDNIVYVGAVDSAVKARRTIDARGKVVTPGFIDLHSHGDATKESFINFLAQGITTVVLGQDGDTALAEGYPVPSLTAWRAGIANPTSATKEPVTLAQWMRLLDARGSEVNVATLSGHGSLRTIAGVGNAPVPTTEQMATMKEILRSDLAAGAFGLSFGLEYAPGRYSLAAEQKELGDLVGRQGGVVMSHMRSEDFDKIGAAVDELLQIDAHVHVSHLKIVAGRRADEANAVLEQLSRARAGGKAVTGDVYAYMASASDLRFLYPEWARSEEDYEAAVKQRRPELEAHLRKRVEERNGPEAILIVGGKYADQRLSQIAAALGKPYEKVIIDELGYGGPPQAHFLMSEAVQNVFIRADQVGISTDGGPGMNHPRSADSFIKVLEQHVGAPPKMSLERAIHKMSGLGAEILGIDRGVLAPGRKADIVVMSPDRLQSHATWTQTTLRPTGLDVIVVNGEVAFENGQAVGLHGKVLKRAGAR